MQKPKKWTEVYPQGTKEGDEENKFFKVLARHPQWQYRSTAHLAAETGLPRKRIEEIIEKYAEGDKCQFDPPLVYAHPEQEGQWGYWERVPEHLEKDKRSITRKDQDRRVKKHIQGQDYIDVNGLPKKSCCDSTSGCDGSCDVQTIENDGNLYKKTSTKKGIHVDLVKEKPKKYIEMKSAYGVSCELKDKTLDMGVGSLENLNLKRKRMEMQTGGQGYMIMKDDHLSPCGQWTVPEDIVYPEIYNFKTPQKDRLTLCDAPQTTTTEVNWNESDKPFDFSAGTDTELNNDEWADTKSAYSLQDESWDAVANDTWITVEDVTWTVTEDVMDIPVPEIPDFPEMILPDVQIPDDMNIVLPPLIFGTCIVDPEMCENAFKQDKIV
jgi:hypothetical protein